MVKNGFRVRRKYSICLGITIISLFLFASCEKFLNPEQELYITEEQLYDDWYEYRSVEMGLYGLQQKLVEQLFILGELRGDLVNITPRASTDMIEVYEFNVSKTNKYADPTNMFKLIAACNNFIRVILREHPEVIDPESQVTNYDRLYGEAVCMRAWTYFNAVRIYGKVPYIHESLATYDEIKDYVNSSGTYTDSIYIDFAKDGYYNDTIENKPIELEKQYYDLEMVVDRFTYEMEHLKAVGVNHYVENNDISWEVTIWSEWARHALLGHMYLTQGDLVRAAEHFEQIIYNTTENYRYQLDNSFSSMGWRNIFTSVDSREHIYTIWFNKADFQQNQFQQFFEPWTPHQYMLKPSYKAVFNWESVWRGQVMDEDLSFPSKTRMIFPGTPTDFYRGFGSSYLYVRNGIPITEEDYENMFTLRAKGDEHSSRVIMEGMDTIIFKYSIGRELFDQDAFYILYRAAGIHLYLAEVYTYWAALRGGLVRTSTAEAVNLVNDGSNYSVLPSRPQQGVRGRVGLGSTRDGIYVGNIIYLHHPFTNAITGYKDYSGNFPAKQKYLEDLILEERVRELAFEGERFYDLMRVAERRNDPSYLASRVSAKFPSGQREAIYDLLMDENNWYIQYFEE
ncbi:MAG TPA: RagB/SusD family nutrient uptake outer membrane protein [Bacteroides sp.]|nr:RagB/SusD family nutrient uptake outer membrane protein [Bacteroides sp.]